MRASKIALRDRLIREGGCTRCWYRKATPGYKTCERCRESFRKYTRNESPQQAYQRKNKRRTFQSRVASAAVKFVEALREVEKSTPNRYVPDDPQLMLKVRKRVQSATRELFQAVEGTYGIRQTNIHG
jgi:hypothetical protein